MHTLQLKIDDSIFEKFMGLIDILPEDKISVKQESDNTVSFEEAKAKVECAINNISNNDGIDIDKAFDLLIKVFQPKRYEKNVVKRGTRFLRQIMPEQ